MSDQEVTYSALRFHQVSSDSQRRSKPDGTRRSGPGEKEFSVPWHLIVVTLGMFCLLLLMTLIVLVIKNIHHIQEKHEQEEFIANLSQKYMPKGNHLKEQLLSNKSLECSTLKNENVQKNKLSSSLKKEGCCAKGHMSSKSLQNPGELLHEDYWSCFDVNCYYFVQEKKNWKGCKQTCQDYRSSLLKIDNEQEQEFIQVQIGENRYWIGLSYDEKERKWKWVDTGSSPGMRGECAFLTSSGMMPIDCSKTYGCICKKKIDCVFRASVCT